MMTSKKKNESGLSAKGHRYWSVMLVGEHGRVIPFRRFKEVAIAIFGIALLSLAALIVLGFFYIQQGRTIEELQSRLADLKAYADQLKDEKDILNARLGIKKAQTTPSLETDRKTEEERIEERAVSSENAATAPEEKKDTAGVSAAAKEVRKPEPAKPDVPVVEWRADIRQPSVDYNRNRNVLRARFRVYNTSVPKKKLSGRTVVVFKNKADPPIKWFAVPNVLLSNGRPKGDAGHDFSINNYITMRHYAYGLKTPQHYDAAVMFVFSDEGKLLASKTFDFKVEPPPPPKPPQPAPRKDVSTAPSTDAATESGTTETTDEQAPTEGEVDAGALQDGNATRIGEGDGASRGTGAHDASTTSTDGSIEGTTGGNETTPFNEAAGPASEKKEPTP